MSLFRVGSNALEIVPSTTFEIEKMMERKDLQRLLRTDISPLGKDLMVIAEEFGNWEDSKRRIDLLCLDREGRLVVVEVKRTEDGGHMELQAIRYAAMVSGMTVEHVVNAHMRMLGDDASEELARKDIAEFLGVDSVDEVEFTKDVRIILVAADFSTEITTSVLWLNKFDHNVSCVRLNPYRIGNHVFIDLTQVIPLPEAADYEVRVRAQAQEAKRIKSAREETLKRFWSQLIERSKGQTSLLANRSTTTDGWISAGLGKGGFELFVSLSKDKARVECYIGFGKDQARAMGAFQALLLKRQQIEADFGATLDWQDLPKRFGCRICKDYVGGWQTPDDDWGPLQQTLIESLMRLESALKNHVQGLSV